MQVNSRVNRSIDFEAKEPHEYPHEYLEKRCMELTSHETAKVGSVKTYYPAGFLGCEFESWEVEYEDGSGSIVKKEDLDKEMQRYNHVTKPSRNLAWEATKGCQSWQRKGNDATPDYVGRQVLAVCNVLPQKHKLAGESLQGIVIEQNASREGFVGGAWHVLFDCGAEEWFDKTRLDKGLKLYKKKASPLPKGLAASCPSAESSAVTSTAGVFHCTATIEKKKVTLFCRRVGKEKILYGTELAALRDEVEFRRGQRS